MPGNRPVINTFQVEIAKFTLENGKNALETHKNRLEIVKFTIENAENDLEYAEFKVAIAEFALENGKNALEIADYKSDSTACQGKIVANWPKTMRFFASAPMSYRADPYFPSQPTTQPAGVLK